MDWSTIAIILATGLVTSGGMVLANWLQNRWAIKLEVSDARRRYREDIAREVREELGKIQEKISWISLSDMISVEAEQKGVKIEPEIREFFKELKGEKEAQKLREIYTDSIPLLATITDEVTRQAIKDALFYALLNSDSFKLKTNDEVKQKIELAYKSLEDFVASAN